MAGSKTKLSISKLTEGRYFSLQEVEDELAIPKNLIYNAAKQLELEITLLFNKYTVYTVKQVQILRQFFYPEHLASISTRKGEFR